MARGGRILILGNGFDIDLGLKTSYRDFLFHIRTTALDGILKFQESE